MVRTKILWLEICPFWPILQFFKRPNASPEKWIVKGVEEGWIRRLPKSNPRSSLVYQIGPKHTNILRSWSTLFACHWYFLVLHRCPIKKSVVSRKYDLIREYIVILFGSCIKVSAELLVNTRGFGHISKQKFCLGRRPIGPEVQLCFQHIDSDEEPPSVGLVCSNAQLVRLN